MVALSWIDEGVNNEERPPNHRLGIGPPYPQLPTPNTHAPLQVQLVEVGMQLIEGGGRAQDLHAQAGAELVHAARHHQQLIGVAVPNLID